MAVFVFLAVFAAVSVGIMYAVQCAAVQYSVKGAF